MSDPGPAPGPPGGTRALRLWFFVWHRRIVLLYGLAWLGAVGSIGSFVARGGGQPTRLEFGVLAAIVGLYLVLALLAD